MHTHRRPRLLAVACFLILVALPCIWFTRQHRQVELDRALIAAIKRSNADRVDSLLATGADPSARDTPEMHASAWQRLRALLHPSKSAMSETALTTALTSDDPEDVHPVTHRIVRSLINAGADVNARTNNGTAALSDCGYWGDYYIVERLISARADVNAKDDLGWTALITAAYHRKSDCVRALIAAGADVNAKDRDGCTALQDAKEGDYPDVADILQKAGAKE